MTTFFEFKENTVDIFTSPIGNTFTEVWSFGGNDQLTGNSGSDYFHAGNGNDYLNGMAGDDVLDGGAGHDDIRGGSGDDLLFGNSGDDTLYGGTGNDLLRGGEGNDEYVVKFNSDSGITTINEDLGLSTGGGFGGGNDVLKFTDKIFSEIGFFQDGNDIVFYDIADAQDGFVDDLVYIENFYLGGDYFVEFLVDSTGTPFDAINLL